MEMTKKGRPFQNKAAYDKIANSTTNTIVITKKEWKLKKPPSAYRLRFYLNAEYEVRSLASKTGWVIRRLSKI